MDENNLLTCKECHTPTEYILTGYRPEMDCWMDCFKSVFACHNETCNIWTHLVPLVISVGLFGYELQGLFCSDCGGGGNGLGVVVYCGCMMTAFLTSTLYHICCCKNASVSQLFLKVDFTGILILLWGSNFPMVWYGFRKYEFLRNVYLGVGTVLVVGVWLAVLLPNIPAKLPLMLFVCLVLFGWIQAIHEFCLHEEPERKWLVPFVYSRAFACYTAGVLFYVFRFPECWFVDGRFDFVGNSHHFWHVFVALGAFIHYFNARLYWGFNENE